MHVQPSSGARCLIFGQTLHLLPYFMWANSEGSGETARMRRLTRAFARRLCYKYHNLLIWLKWESNALICPFISSFFFLQFSTLKFFVTLFSGTVRPRRLKIDTHVDSGQMYHVYQNQAAAAYSSLYFFIFLSLQFSTLKFCVTLFSGTARPRRLKIDTHMDSGQMYHLYQNQAAAGYSSLYFFIFLSLQFSTLKFFITLFSGTVRPRRLKFATHINSGQMYLVYWNQAATSYLSLYFFIFLFLQFSNIKVFRHTLLRNCEA